MRIDMVMVIDLRKLSQWAKLISELRHLIGYGGNRKNTKEVLVDLMLKNGQSLLVTGFAPSLVLVAWFAIGAVQADDGGISFGGSPHLLKGHPSVSMDSEIVQMDIGKDLIKVDCNFVFKNIGPACVVRMGFPDQGEGAEEPYQGEPLPPLSKLRATFLSYDSYVNGRRVKTKLVPTNDRSLFWHTKVVRFPAKATVKVRDVYTLKPGAQVTSEKNGIYSQTQYVLHTGASWRGPIRRAEIICRFAPGAAPEPIKLLAKSEIKDKEFYDLKWSKLPVGTVVWQGTSVPRLQGRSLRFLRNQFEPGNKDDIRLYYAYHALNNAFSSDPAATK